MRHVVRLVGQALHGMAVLLVVATFAASLRAVRPAGTLPWPGRNWARDPGVWCLAALALVALNREAWGAWRAARGGAAALRRAWSAWHPRRGVIGRWYHLTFCEPLAMPDQAREALARLCGYRLRRGDDRIASIRPGLRGRRLGAWVAVASPSRSTRRWECRYVRWVDDPNELWLLRSALQPEPMPAPEPSPEPAHRPGTLERMSEAELDHLLRRPSRPDLSDRPSPSAAPP